MSEPTPPKTESKIPHTGQGGRRSLRVELVGTLAVVLMMAVVSLSLVGELLGQRRHNSQEIQRLQDHARGLASLVAAEYGGGQFDRSALERLLRQSSTQLGAVMEVHRVSNGGTELLESTGFHDPLAPAPDGSPRVDESLLKSHNLLVIDEPLWLPDGNARGTIVLRIVAEPSAWTSGHDWPETLLVATGVGIVLLVLGGLMIEMQVLRPLRTVQKAASLVTQGNLYANIAEDGPSEFRSLAMTFNQMTQALQAQRDQIEGQAARLQRAKQLATIGSLSAGVAHEVGNPLAALLGYTEFLLDPRDASSLSDEQRNVLERMQAQTQRIQRIVGQLLDFSRPSESTAVLVTARPLLEEIVALLRADPRAADVLIEVTGPSDLEMMADPGLLEQVILNLVLNAVRAAKSGDGDPPRVRLQVADDEIEIQDNGPGVPDKDRPRLFEPFFTTSGAGEGTGLGLAISHGLVDAMGGRLECLDAGARPPLDPGGPTGAVFRVSLASS